MGNETKRAHRAGRSSREALADTWYEAADKLLRRIREEATEQELQDALTQPTTISSVSLMLSRAAATTSDFDHLAPALARASQAKADLVEQAGGAVGRVQVAELLGIQPAAVDQRRRRGQLLAVESLGGQYIYPTCQFTSEGSLPHLAEVLDALEVDDGWIRLDMLLSPIEGLGGRSAIEVLRAEPDPRTLDDLLEMLRTWSG